MSRRTDRRRQNVDSLMKARLHACAIPGCTEPGRPCCENYLDARTSRYLCLEHRGTQGYCYDCGVKVEDTRKGGEGQRFRTGPGKGFCDGCWDGYSELHPAEPEPDDRHGLGAPPPPTRFDVIEL